MRTFFCGLALLLSSVCMATYHSQCGQDKFVNENYFKDQRNKVFVDIGANNGISLSNTYFFEKELGWTGICVEPIPETFAMLTKNRDCLCIEGCIADFSGLGQFLRITGPLEMLSGLLKKYDPRHMERIRKQLSVYGGSSEIINVKCYRFNELMEQNHINHIHFLSIDIEGAEFDVLSTIDFSQIQIDVITVENNYNDPRYLALLSKKGFILAKRLDQDMIFVNKNFK